MKRDLHTLKQMSSLNDRWVEAVNLGEIAEDVVLKTEVARFPMKRLLAACVESGKTTVSDLVQKIINYKPTKSGSGGDVDKSKIENFVRPRIGKLFLQPENFEKWLDSRGATRFANKVNKGETISYSKLKNAIYKFEEGVIFGHANPNRDGEDEEIDLSDFDTYENENSQPE